MTTRVIFQPSGIAAELEDQPTVLQLARRVGVDLDSVCAGRGLCGRCQVTMATGEFPKWGLTVDADALSPPGPVETDYHGNRPLAADHRLGCATRILGDVVIDIPPHSQVHRQVVRKGLDLGATPVRLDPVNTAMYLEPAAPELDGPASTTEILRAAWTAAGHHGRLQFDPATIPHLAVASSPNASTGGVTLICETATLETDQPAVRAVYPGLVDSILGIAIDVGSTTVAGHLIDLTDGRPLSSAGVMNPQIRFGEDLMSRVSHVMMHPEGRSELTDSIRTAIAELTGQLTAQATPDDGSPLPPIQQVAVVGNPIMLHLLAGLNPTPLGTAPFTAVTTDALSIPASQIGIDVPMAQAYLLPAIAGHVGADAVAAVLATEPARDEPAHTGPPHGEDLQAEIGTRLVIDVGTNAELVLTDNTGRFAASSPTGPAFEGAQLSCGQRATAGAIERVRIDRQTLEPRFKVIGADAWSDEPAFPSQTRRLSISGVCGSGVIELIGELFLSGVITADGTISAERASTSDRIVADGRTYKYVLVQGEDREVSLTQNDVRAIQLAKAALRAGIDLLVERIPGGSGSLTRVDLAGAFGAHIDPAYAMTLGLIPNLDLSLVHGVGNAAGSGAVRALLSAHERARAERIARQTTKVETATEPRFLELFVAAIPFPHADTASHSTRRRRRRTPSERST